MRLQECGRMGCTDLGPPFGLRGHCPLMSHTSAFTCLPRCHGIDEVALRLAVLRSHGSSTLCDLGQIRNNRGDQVVSRRPGWSFVPARVGLARISGADGGAHSHRRLFCSVSCPLQRSDCRMRGESMELPKSESSLGVEEGPCDWQSGVRSVRAASRSGRVRLATSRMSAEAVAAQGWRRESGVLCSPGFSRASIPHLVTGRGQTRTQRAPPDTPVLGQMDPPPSAVLGE